MQADISGLMAQPIPDWQRRVEALARPEFFQVSISPKKELLDQLTAEEKTRLFAKLKLVREYTKIMAAGMAKGTVKYATDNYHLPQWFAHLLGEGADQSNYALLLADAYERSQAAAAPAPPTFIPDACEKCGGKLTLNQKVNPVTFLPDGVKAPKYLCTGCFSQCVAVPDPTEAP